MVHASGETDMEMETQSNVMKEAAVRAKQPSHQFLLHAKSWCNQARELGDHECASN